MSEETQKLAGENTLLDELVTAIPQDSLALITISGDGLNASLTITEPQNGGTELTLEDVMKEINTTGVTFGIKKDVVADMVERGIYDKKTIIATGIEPVDGIDGYIEYFYEPSSDLAPKTAEFDEVDYKNLGLVKNIYKDTPILKVVKPQEGTDGMDVSGLVITPMPPKSATCKVGGGTILDEETGELRAAVDGNLTWEKDHFNVAEDLIIKENIDVSTGNIDFIGNVIVKGEVRENYTVKSGKNITVNGSVIGATLIADGDVNLSMGCINTDVIARGNVKIAFCEGSKIQCDGDIMSASFIMCDVFCGGKLSAITGKGVIVGGKYTAIEGMTANIIGSETYTKTRITLGNGAVLNEEKLDQQGRIRELEIQINKLIQVVELLQAHKKTTGQLSPDREAMLSSAIRTRFTNQKEIKQRMVRISQLEELLAESQELYVVAKKTLWPGVTIRIDSDIITSEQCYTRTSVGRNGEGELSFLPMTGKG